MKIKRFFAKDMRSALEQVKEALGNDAVIMSNKKVTGGVEILAAIDFDDVDLQQHSQGPSSPIETAQIDKASALSEDKVALSSKAQAHYQRARTEAEHKPAESLEQLLQRQHSPAAKVKFNPFEKPEPAKDTGVSRDEILAIKSELRTVRELLQSQVSSLIKDDKHRQNPIASMYFDKLKELDFSNAVAEHLVSQLDVDGDIQAQLIDELAGLLKTERSDLSVNGGVIALVGPTGVGKTTTLAKLAARYVQKFGAEQVALITTDHYRIGAYEQLATYGRILGCNVKCADDYNQLEQALYQFRNCRLVLIDTAGMSQKDLRLTQQLDNLTANNNVPIKSYLLINSTTQRGGLAEVYKQFSRIPLSGCIISKTDEAFALGGALSIAIEQQLKISYITNGQRVPEDLNLANCYDLAKSALKDFEQQVPAQSVALTAGGL
ncbi:flagellar biosynthesis protein FlhF [Paraferrimonas sp. SM1919]|uniref:flagellar biosynthesis protein FlhF n=1 Tax=Paraferrimonas sp. SM1919 TaxID=2662263 RepID=UPI0013D73605|nr:flagellar biosynthesis protein FlhF [Paraferrimonas sp. SM1919]